jgi:hypothetical protein
MKIGEKVRFLNNGRFVRFDSYIDYTDCYGVIREIHGDCLAAVEAFCKDGTKHPAFMSSSYYFYDSEIEVIDEA